jgi:uncharacterized coiled-coil protein SlyX
MDKLAKIQALIHKLEQVNEERIRAEERVRTEEAVLEKLGYDSVEEAEEGYEQMTKELNSTIKKLETMYTEFMEDYENVLQ